MAPNKKKKKPVSHPARGFATVSTPSKKADESPQEPKDNPEAPSTDGKPMNATTRLHDHGGPEDVASEVRHMTPEELERHLEEAELQSLLDVHGQSSKNDVGRQKARLEAERRNLRRGGMMLETESWLSPVMEEVLELGRSSEDLVPTKKSGEHLDDTDLCVKLWTVQQTLDSLHFRNIDGALKHLIRMSSVLPKPYSSSLIWGLDEALNWLARWSEPEDLPAYDHQNLRSIPTSRPSSPPSAYASGETIDASDSPTNTFYSCSTSTDDANPSASSSTPENHAENEASVTTNTVSDDSDDNDPDQLVDKFLSAKYELLKDSLDSKANQQEQRLSEQQCLRLKRRIERIERDILFEQEDAMGRWEALRNDLEIEHARSKALNMRQKRATKTRVSTDIAAPAVDAEYIQQNENDEVGEDLFGSIFASNDNTDLDTSEVAAQTVTLRDFSPAGVGASPSRVLEDVCKARDPICKIIVRQISSSSHSFRHSARIIWSKDQNITIPSSYLPAQISYELQPRLTGASMLSIATTSSASSEGYLCTLLLFMLSQWTNSDKIRLRLQTVWRDVWTEHLVGKQEAMDRADRDALRQIQKLITAERTMQKEEVNDHIKQKPPVQGLDERPRPPEKAKIEYSREQLVSLWEGKTSVASYQKMLQIRQRLPIWDYRQQIVDTISGNQVTVLCAETGAGKSTQMPSFVLQSYLSAGHDCKILVTQPRRISAISLARRVSEELGEQKSDIGTTKSLVGYAIRLESKIASTTRITYVTTGVLVRMLESSKNLVDTNVLILDEVHERTMDLDLLCIALRRLMKRRHDLKIVLMSATVDATRFSEYFGNAPVLLIPGRSFPVEIKFLEDAIELTRGRNNEILGPDVVERFEEEGVTDKNESERTKSLTVGLEKYSALTRKTLASFDEYRIDYSLIANLVMTISSDDSLRKFSKAILIFMPGIAEIRRLHNTILSLPAFQSGWIIHLLHSSFSNDDLERAFEVPPPHRRKIVIATNIAETGITIPDVTAVIDSCREKVMRFDERRQLSKLTEAFISRSSARQRRGRAARVQDGLCFHLVTRYRHDNLFPKYHVPEMLRLSLQDPILRIKIWDLGDIEQTLSEAFDPPTSKNIRRTIDLLKDVKALRDNESLTSLGKQLAKLPLDIWLGKLVLHGVTFKCLDATTFIAAMLSAKSPFIESSQLNQRAAAAKLAFNKGNSDLLLVYNAYCAWRRACHTGTGQDFCRKNFLNHSTLWQIEDVKVQLLVALSDASILALDETEKQSLRRARLDARRRDFFAIPDRYNLNSDNEFAVEPVIALALYPKLLLRERQAWKNIANNQQVNLSPTSINHGSSSSPAKWLSFYQTMQTKSKSPQVFETSLVPEFAVVILLGQAEFKMYGGVITLDGGRIRFSVRDWRTMAVLKVLRTKIQEALSRSSQDTGSRLTSPFDARWFDIWQKIVASRKASEI